ncbi:hypothetical protein E8E12_010697 [Didymella heteroderae]|uniref:Uncharacterized protein n=1 Tax=Didymella heteroderae TaxID=1769908 RepID=A0A9P4WYZ4_9PLEO|nr:hypothetical protein E8E12_010697 [Didymella heteroderae]
MKPLNRLARLKPALFKLSYSPAYTSFLPNHIATNTSHPLNITQRRLLKQRKQEGLWWHTTTGTDISKLSCVRHWALRRLKRAFVEELRERGYDESGKLVDVGKIEDAYVQRVVKSGRRVDMAGSLRMHGVPTLVPAKYEKVKEEVRAIVDALVQTAVDAALESRAEESRDKASERRPHAQRAQSQRPTAAPARGRAMKKMVPVEKEPSRVKPKVSPALPIKTRTAVAAAPRVKPKAPARAAPRSRKSSTMSLGEDYCV